MLKYNLYITDTNYCSPLVNSQAEGILCLTSYKDNLIINNLGKNIELSKLNINNHQCKLKKNAIYDFSFFSSLDEESQFDMDMHALLIKNNYLFALNHYGIIRIFNLKQNLQPEYLLRFASDTEHTSIINRQLLTSSSSIYGISDSPTTGLIVSNPLITQTYIEKDFMNLNEMVANIYQLDYFTILNNLGKINIIANNPQLNLLALANDTTFLVYAYNEKPFFKLENLVCSFKINYLVKNICFIDNHLLISGYESKQSEKSYDDIFKYNQELTSHIQLYSLNGENIWSRCENSTIAWGFGGKPITYDQKNQVIYLVLRNSTLKMLDFRNGQVLDLNSPATLTAQNFGTANLNLHQNHLICTFNRANYRLFHYNFD